MEYNNLNGNQGGSGPFKVLVFHSSQNIFICSGEKNAISGGSPCTDHDGADDDTEEEEEEENIDVGLIDNLKTAGGALLLLVLFLRNTSIIIVSGILRNHETHLIA